MSVSGLKQAVLKTLMLLTVLLVANLPLTHKPVHKWASDTASTAAVAAAAATVHGRKGD